MIRKYITKPLRDMVKRKVKNIYDEIEFKKTELESKIQKPIIPVLYFPYLHDTPSYIIPQNKVEQEVCEQGLPIPPHSLWLGYGSTKDDYLEPGKKQVNVMMKLLKSHGFDLSGEKKILDLGCGAGRMIRWLKPLSGESEIWGTDISSEHIYWANKYLNPPFNFATTTTVPHLPFEDRYFDLIYAGSVFTHIDDLAESWLLEVKRILKDDGFLYLTIHDKGTFDLINSKPVWKDSFISQMLNENRQFVNENFDVFVMMRGPASQVFYDIDYFKKSVKNIFEVLSVNPGSYGYQTGVVLKRKSALNN
ncbi:MAG: class I SAM-dependent methyltransferase [bacterium]